MTYIIEERRVERGGLTYRAGRYRDGHAGGDLALNVSRCWYCGTPESKELDGKRCDDASEYHERWKWPHEWYVPVSGKEESE